MELADIRLEKECFEIVYRIIQHSFPKTVVIVAAG